MGSCKVIVHSHHTYQFSYFSLSSISYIVSGIGFSKLAKGLKAQRVKVVGKI
jgi:hypothetical protein